MQLLHPWNPHRSGHQFFPVEMGLTVVCKLTQNQLQFAAAFGHQTAFGLVDDFDQILVV